MSDLVERLSKAADRLGYDVENGNDGLGLKLHDINAIDEAANLLDEARSILARLEPHLDAIVCYASTMDEHEPNRIAVDARATLAKLSSQSLIDGEG